jgi:hypothetical protein
MLSLASQIELPCSVSCHVPLWLQSKLNLQVPLAFSTTYTSNYIIDKIWSNPSSYNWQLMAPLESISIKINIRVIQSKLVQPYMDLSSDSDLDLQVLSSNIFCRLVEQVVGCLLLQQISLLLLGRVQKCKIILHMIIKEGQCSTQGSVIILFTKVHRYPKWYVCIVNRLLFPTDLRRLSPSIVRQRERAFKQYV